MRRLSVLVVVLCVVVGHGAIVNPCDDDKISALPFCNLSLSIVDRTNDLVSRFTLAEKAAQLVHIPDPIPRLNIPQYYWWSEALHGVLAACTDDGRCPTIYPMPIGIGATFNMDLVAEMTKQISTEGRRLYFEQANGQSTYQVGLDFWAPNINIFRDPRWGRGQETPGEDPYLNAQYAINYIKNMQEGEDTRYLKTVATLKHFDAYSLENWKGMDRHHFDAIVSDVDLLQTYLVPFEAGVKEGNARSLMCSYNSVNGIPSCANKLLMDTILRKNWGFTGYTTSDCGAISDIYKTHEYASSAEEATADALNAGTDLNCGSVFRNAKNAVDEGILNESVIDQSLFRLFSHRMRLGMFDPLDDQVYLQYPADVVGHPDHQKHALLMATESLTLLKNTNGFLPLDPSTLSKVAVVGPHTNTTTSLCGNYFKGVSPVVTVFEGIASHVGSSNIVSATGCSISSTSTAGFSAAVEVAKSADVVFVVVGIDGSIERESRDRESITFPGVQEQFIEAVSFAQPNTVLIVVNGGPIDLSAAKESSNIQSILEVFYPGERGGEAIGNVIFGQDSPSGRLPYTIYPASYVDAISMEEMSMSAAPGRSYRFYTGDAVYPFGYGLSYTTFKYQWKSISVGDGGEMNYAVNVTNTGLVPSAVSVLGYLSYAKPLPNCPQKQLFAFKKLYLKPGETVETEFYATPSAALCVEDGKVLQSSGHYNVEIGDLRHTFLYDEQLGSVLVE